MLHATAVFLEPFVIPPIFGGSMQEVKSFEDIVCQGMAALGFT
jgi:hypothetical protein